MFMFNSKKFMRVIQTAAILSFARGHRGICDNQDMSLLGGSGDVIIDRVEKCLPEVIWENNMAQVEECIDTSFNLDVISVGCKECFAKFADKNELEFKMCVFKCNGPARTTSVCQKCKEQVALGWDSMCFNPENAKDGSIKGKRENRFQGGGKGSSRIVDNALVLIIVPIVLILS